jgi:hypothetical protein
MRRRIVVGDAAIRERSPRNAGRKVIRDFIRREFCSLQVYLAGVKGAEREDPTLQGGAESGAALRHAFM